MNKQDLIEAVAAEVGVTKADSEKAVNATFMAIANALSSGDDVAIPSFGNFVVKQRAARKGRNPQTGAVIDIPATTVASFKVSSVLKKAVK